MQTLTRHARTQAKQRIAEHMYRRHTLRMLRSALEAFCEELQDGYARRNGMVRLVSRCAMRAQRQKEVREREDALVKDKADAEAQCKDMQSQLADKADKLALAERKFGQLIAWVQSKAQEAQARSAGGDGTAGGPLPVRDVSPPASSPAAASPALRGIVDSNSNHNNAQAASVSPAFAPPGLHAYMAGANPSRSGSGTKKAGNSRPGSMASKR
jgi:hypothetical protein